MNRWILATLFVASQASAMSVQPDLADDQSAVAQVLGIDQIGPDPAGHPWSFSLEYGDTFVGQRGTYLNEAAIATGGGALVVGFNTTGLLTNNVGFAVSVDNGVTWRPEYSPITVRNPFRDEFQYSSDPGVAVCRTSRGKAKTLVSWVQFGTDFLTTADPTGGHYNCRADNIFAITGTQDKGVRWDIVHPVARGPGLFRDRPMIACDPASPRCWAMFNGYSPEPGIGYCIEEASRIFVATSDNCGATWSTPTVVGPGHMAPTNLFVLRDGRVRFGVFTNQVVFNVMECSTGQVCKILATSGNDYVASFSDVAHLQGLPDTRVNSCPVIGCDPYGHKCTVAYMAERGMTMDGRIDRASVVYRTSVDDGVTWSAGALAPQLNAFQPDQILPMLSWGSTSPGLCWYQRQHLNLNPPADHIFKVVCSNSNDGGLTWNPPVQVGPDVQMPTKDVLGVQGFLGDYNMLDSLGGWMALTTLLPPEVTGGVATKPVIEILPYKPDPGCQLDPTSTFSWWSVLFPLLLLLRVWVTPVSAATSCMGDCNGDGIVQVNELVTNVLIALDETDVGECLNPVDINPDYGPPIVSMIQAVNNALEGCE